MASSLEEFWTVSEDEESYENISLDLCELLDKIGYSEQMINYRRQVYQEQVVILKYLDDEQVFLISGSKGEGLTAAFESDTDITHLYKDVICTEEGYAHQAPPNSTIFTFRPGYKQPGYNILRLQSFDFNSAPTEFLSSLIHVHSPTHHLILSSDDFVEDAIAWENENKHSEIQFLGRSGPATTTLVGQLEYDRVYSIPSVSPSVLQRWSQRPRHHDWPPVALRDRIANMRGNFVAKGCKGSPLEKHEWRQCFNEAELLLVHSFDETLTKLYVLLKMITKDILRPLDNDKSLTSYVMKNIVFWLAEENPSDSFQPKYLIKWLIKALRILKKYLENGVVSYYMIPERNLLHPGISKKVNKRLVECVESLIKQGPGMLDRCEKLALAMRMTHAELSEFGDKRDELERLHLSWWNYEHILIKQGLSYKQIVCDETRAAMTTKISELVRSKWPHHIEKNFDKCKLEWDRRAYILGKQDKPQ